MMETKKAIRRENYLHQFLSPYKIKVLIDTINKTAIQNKIEDKITSIKNISESSTIGPLNKPEAQSLHQTLPRIDSAAEILLFGTEEEGPYEGQMSRGVSTNLDFIVNRKPIFYVLEETNLESEYLKKIDYSNPILLRNKQEIVIREQLVKETENTDSLLFDFHRYGRIIKKYIDERNQVIILPSLKNRILPQPRFMTV